MENPEAPLEFRRVPVFSTAARVLAVGPSGEVELPRDPRQFFMAMNSSMGIGLAVNPDNGEVRGFASKHGQVLRIAGNYMGKLEFAPLKQVKDESNYCGTEMPDQPIDMAQGVDYAAPRSASLAKAGETISYQAVVAIETDSEWLDGFSDDTAAATQWIADLFLAMNVFYERDIETRLLIGDVILRTGTDPYTVPSNRYEQLNEFGAYWMDNMGSVDRHFAAMFSGRDINPLSFSGIAWIDQYCDYGHPANGGADTAGSYSFNAIGSSRTAGNTALYVGHELGHNLGSPHTHCYNPPVDHCYNGNGNCYTGNPSCPAGGKGTVMSYCHIGGQNGAGCGTSNQEFHPTVQSLLENNLAAENVAGCIDTYANPNPAPEFDSSPAGGAVLNFGDQQVGMESPPIQIQIENLGDADLTVSCALSGAGQGSFHINSCVSLLAPAASAAVSVSCEPLSPDPLQALLTLTTNDADEGIVTFDLICNGIDPPSEDVIFSEGFEDPQA